MLLSPSLNPTFSSHARYYAVRIEYRAKMRQCSPNFVPVTRNAVR